MIRLENITKYYILQNKQRHYIFKNLNFSFPDDCSIGLLGKNGAGKSTLLRILGGLELANKGRVITNQKISWPIGFSSGFQGSLSARDNIKFIARVYGYNSNEIKEKIEFVRAFAEIGSFFDEPVKNYSSGMKSRISFGISMAFDFDYYLIDEAGAVGDPSFKQKSVELYEKKLSTSKVIMVSHSADEIKRWCNKVVILANNEAKIYDVDEGLEIYKESC
ncbi:ABC transporter ATP-binding protein [Campylobacter canadensis]|uniref:ABC transporter ATP-binding protein n=1 Tax=Campylobacter canadensis TaxID=449520 RepID=A0ABS7WUA6_9BACT|nr:ABC transporter ATP-binding protein [Campylobacter canadensis]MBZ7987912.1 ABC transporter ATP-binding protein [Campylobacter canadensis]MBZ7995388.1 ABC transporter ATP-binding protein [Campylobacter canadensis]MBZ7997067.1 ABC transporter ATP-binding protein [Campylobacter canadensis]MBZ7998885.1 ABC transporter ATP-binding protein [Campylobacter canadensis]MBZ8000564.1 ABC transporter ATP-binding protein [Campylobacter canadensis]